MWKKCKIENIEKYVYKLSINKEIIAYTSNLASDKPKIPQELITEYEENGVREVEVEFDCLFTYPIESSCDKGDSCDYPNCKEYKPKTIGNGYINWRLIDINDYEGIQIDTSKSKINEILNSKSINIELAAGEYLCRKDYLNDEEVEDAFIDGANWYKKQMKLKT